LRAFPTTDIVNAYTTAALVTPGAPITLHAKRATTQHRHYFPTQCDKIQLVHSNGSDRHTNEPMHFLCIVLHRFIATSSRANTHKITFFLICCACISDQPESLQLTRTSASSL